jgi:hypothetical protein
MRCLSLTRYLLSLAAVLLAVGVCAPRAQASFIVNKPSALGLNNGLVGWWTFDGKDVSGVQAYDRSGNGNTGRYWNATGTPPAVGKIGQGMKFDGVDDYVSINSGAVGNNESFTLSAWFKTSSSAGSQRIYEERNGAAGAGRFYIAHSIGFSGRPMGLEY